jgi:hypothetical protein
VLDATLVDAGLRLSKQCSGIEDGRRRSEDKLEWSIHHQRNWTTPKCGNSNAAEYVCMRHSRAASPEEEPVAIGDGTKYVDEFLMSERMQGTDVLEAKCRT